MFDGIASVVTAGWTAREGNFQVLAGKIAIARAAAVGFCVRECRMAARRFPGSPRESILDDRSIRTCTAKDAEPHISFGRPVVAVLPFSVAEQDSDARILADGMHEDICGELTRFRSRRVISSASAAVVVNLPDDVVGARLAASHILRLRVRRRDRLENQVVARIAATLNVKLEEMALASATPDPGLDHVQRDAENVPRRQVLCLETREVGGLDQRADTVAHGRCHFDCARR